MAPGPSSFVVDADLHGLVDGHLDVDRRADALRRLAGSPADRARVEAWQTQNDLLRSAFAGVDREPLPALLDLTAKPRLQCVAANDSLLVGPGIAPRPTPIRRRFGLALATILVIGAGLGGTWMVLDSADTNDPVATATLRGSIDAALAGRSAGAVDRPLSVAIAAPEGERLPATQIPDLRAAGFSFTGADVDGREPISVLFRYQNGAAERLVLSVAHAPPQDRPGTSPVRIGNAYTWHRHNSVYALAGTIRPVRLHAIAAALQGGASGD